MKMSDYTRPRVGPGSQPGALLGLGPIPNSERAFGDLWLLAAQLRTLCIYDYFPFYFIY